MNKYTESRNLLPQCSHYVFHKPLLQLWAQPVLQLAQRQLWKRHPCIPMQCCRRQGLGRESAPDNTKNCLASVRKNQSASFFFEIGKNCSAPPHCFALLSSPVPPRTTLIEANANPKSGCHCLRWFTHPDLFLSFLGAKICHAAPTTST